MTDASPRTTPSQRAGWLRLPGLPRWSVAAPLLAAYARAVHQVLFASFLLLAVVP